MTYQQYLQEHGINQDSIERFGLYERDGNLVIPVRDVEGNVVFEKERNLSDIGPKFKIPAGEKNTLFNPSALASEKPYLVLASGEIDAIKLEQEGFPAIASVTGEGSFPEEWLNQIPLNKRLVICMDNDAAGKAAALSHLEKFPLAFNFELPEGSGKDVCEFFNRSSKADFIELFQRQFKEQVLGFEGLCEVIDKWLLVPDKDFIKVLLACVISHYFESDPLWMFFVAPPSGTKTEILNMTVGLPLVHFISSLTPKTLISGMSKRGETEPSLLMRLPNNILVMKDFTTVLSMRSEDRQEILSALREVYDGRFSKEFGTGVTVSWEGRITLISGVTTIIDTHSAVFQMMGERFLIFRIVQPEAVEVAFKASGGSGQEKVMRSELDNAMQRYFKGIEKTKGEDIEIPAPIIECLINLAAFIVRARSGVIRDPYSKEIMYIPEPEMTPRFTKQLVVLIKALAVVGGRKVVNWADYFIAVRIAFDEIPANKMKTIAALASVDDFSKIHMLLDYTEYSANALRYNLEELKALKLVVKSDNTYEEDSGWSFSPLANSYLAKTLPKDQDEKVLEYFQNFSFFPIVKKVLRIYQL